MGFTEWQSNLWKIQFTHTYNYITLKLLFWKLLIPLCICQPLSCNKNSMRCSKCVEKLSYFSFLAKSYCPKQQVKYLINNTYQYLQHSTYSTSFFNIQTDLLFVHDLIYFSPHPAHLLPFVLRRRMGEGTRSRASGLRSGFRWRQKRHRCTMGNSNWGNVSFSRSQVTYISN